MSLFRPGTPYLALWLAAFPLSLLSAQNQDFASTDRVLDLSTALELALQFDPTREVHEARRDVAEGHLEQAALAPNPVISAEVENFLGSHDFGGTDALELTLGLRQVIETAGKRAKRTALAQESRDALEAARAVELADRTDRVRQAFFAVWWAQEAVALRADQLALAEASAAETTRLTEAARASEVERSRAQLAVRQQHFALAQAQRQLTAAQTALALEWGTDNPTPYRVAAKVSLDLPLPPWQTLVAALPESPLLRPYAAERRVRDAARVVEEAKARPDVEVFGGVRYANEGPGSAGFVVGVEIPWSFRDQNQGNIRAARAEARALEHELASAQSELVRRLRLAYQALTAATAEIAELDDVLLPSAESTLADTESAYQRGQFTQLAVLDARTALFALREARLDALQRYADAEGEIAYLLGQPAH